jgi:hypothetical protein
MCSICLELELESNNTNNTNMVSGVITTLCNHTFHKKCLQSCIHYGIKECPLCRTNIESDIKKYGFEVKPVIPVESKVESESESESEYYYDSDDTVPAMDNSTYEQEPGRRTTVDRFHFLYSFGFRRKNNTRKIYLKYSL